MSHKGNNSKSQSLNMFYHDEDLSADFLTINNNNSNDDDKDNELLDDFSNGKVIKDFAKKKAIIHEKPGRSNKEKLINDKFISELSNRSHFQGEYSQSKSNEKKLESNLELKYGKGYKLLKLAGYKIGSGLGAKEQGITDPLEIKVRKKKAGISQEDEYENPMKEDSKNNFLLGRKRQGMEKAFDETNDEMNLFERLIELYSTNAKDNEELIESMLIKLKEYSKAERKASLYKSTVHQLNSMPMQADISKKYIGKEFNLNEIRSQSQSKGNNSNSHINIKEEHNKQLLIELIDKTKSKVISYLNVYFSNKNNRAILTKLSETSQDDQIQIESEYKQKLMFLSQLESSNLNEISNGNAIEYIHKFLSLYDNYPKQFRASSSELCLVCLKQTIRYFQSLYKVVTDYFDEAKAESFIVASALVKDLIEKSYSDFDSRDLNNDHMFSFNNRPDASSRNRKASTYYSFFISEVLLRYMNDIITNQWNIKEYSKLIKFFQLYIDIIPSGLMETISQLIAKKIIDFIMNSLSFVPSRDDIFIHNWIHPWLDILSLKAIESIEVSIERKIMSDILAWNIEEEDVNNKLIALLLPWKAVFRSAFWEELETKFLYPKLSFMFNSLKINPSEQSIQPFMVMFKLIESNLIHKEKCIPVLKRAFFPKWLKTLNHWLKHGGSEQGGGGVSKDKLNEIQHWYKGWKELLNEQFKDYEVINTELKDGLILIYKYTKK